MRIYVDTDLIVHFIQANLPISGSVAAKILKVGVRTVVSDLTRMECSVIDLQRGGTLRKDFDIFLAPCEVLQLSPQVLEKAAEILAAHRFGVVCAIHLAAATVHGCDEFLTHSRRLKRYTGVPVTVV